MHPWIFYPHLTRRSDGLQYLILQFPERPFLGLIGKAASLPIKVTPNFWRGWNLSISRIFCFTRGLVQHIGFSGKYPGLWSVLEVPLLFFALNVFQRRLKRCRQYCWIFPRNLAWLFRPISSRRSPHLSSGYFTHLTALFWRRYFGILVPWLFPVKKGAPCSRRDCSSGFDYRITLSHSEFSKWLTRLLGYYKIQNWC